MDPSSKSYRPFLHLFHTDQHFIYKFFHSLTRNWMQPVFGAKASPLVILRVYLIWSHLPCRCFRVRCTGNGDDDGAPGTLRRVPYLLLSVSVYHSYHFPFRPVFVHARVYQLLGPSQVPCLPDTEQGIPLPLCTLHRHG